PSFLGHILVELLLDATLFENDLPRLDAYYAALAELDPEVVQKGINVIATKQTDRITTLLPRFLADRFLYDYLEDAKLLTRLGHIMRRVGLPGLPAELVALFPSLRAQVRQRQAALL